MPRTVLAGSENTITIEAANDLLTILFLAAGTDSIVNYGPGDLWMTRNGTPPTIGGENCLLLKPNIGFTEANTPPGKRQTWQVLATQPNTTLSFSIGPQY